MAQKVVVRLIDDLDGSDADTTVNFSLDGVAYEIDLADGNARQLRDSLKKYIGGARKAGKPGRTRRPQVTSGGPAPKDVRDWAAANGVAVNARGRLSSDVVEKYLAAH
ncbi:Lsr2 family protein [Arthrobacter sp. CAU 1506]|uniref:histone-like nucleoid-structuring protein Lsr2 n=1 Tax=Arthrobacter sp. CAU 1506 TaxID=2560052 RepID=UPI0010ABDFC1|nr:Lsr2 family protein [Arthrobacter sp. CAU 1506]TJY66293.1 Lsr2 family protein [Arthrobacter sp. CAU 1506]